jgi:hypothetical protein
MSALLVEIISESNHRTAKVGESIIDLMMVAPHGKLILPPEKLSPDSFVQIDEI